MVATWNQEKEQAYLNVFQQVGDSEADNDTVGLDPRVLASSVVSCGDGRCLNRPNGKGSLMIGWADAQKHQCYRPNPSGGDYLGLTTKYQICDRGRDVVFSLLSLLGLNPAVTLAVDLDRLTARFKCLCCPDLVNPRNKAGRKAAQGFDWRESVSHFVQHKKKSHPESKWGIIPVGQAAKTRAPSEPAATASSKDSAGRPHLNPDAKVLLCMLCKGKNINRRFIEHGVRSHLLQVHSVKDAVYGTHFSIHKAWLQHLKVKTYGLWFACTRPI